MSYYYNILLAFSKKKKRKKKIKASTYISISKVQFVLQQAPEHSSLDGT